LKSEERNTVEENTALRDDVSFARVRADGRTNSTETTRTGGGIRDAGLAEDVAVYGDDVVDDWCDEWEG
jgi:hypothetical protein